MVIICVRYDAFPDFESQAAAPGRSYTVSSFHIHAETDMLLVSVIKRMVSDIVCMAVYQAYGV